MGLGLNLDFKENRRLNKTQLISQSLSIQINTLFPFKYIQS